MCLMMVMSIIPMLKTALSHGLRLAGRHGPGIGTRLGQLGKENLAVLRSAENSERCEPENLVLRETHTRDEVYAAIVKYCQRL